jgi:hypothetical protein
MPAMFTVAQRIQIMKYSGGSLLAISLIPVVAHGLFFFSVLQQYVYLGIIYALSHFGYNATKKILAW